MKTLKKIWNVISGFIIYFLIGILALYLCLVIYQKVFKQSELLNIGDYYIFQIASSSMETDLHIGDYIVVLHSDNYKVGDVITFMEDEVYITHRIQKIEGNKIITKGDANETLDDSITREEILGKVLFKLTFLSFIIKNKYIIVALILASFILEKVFKNNEETNEELTNEETINEEQKNEI